MKSVKLVIPAMFLIGTSIGGVALAATHAEPLVKVVPTVRYEPPEEEVGVVMTVNRVTPKPKSVEANILFDREGAGDRPEVLVSIEILNVPTSVHYFYEEGDDEPFIPSPTSGRISRFAVKVLDKTCNLSGVC